MIELSAETRTRIYAVFPEHRRLEVEACLQAECGDNLPLVDPSCLELAQRIRFAVVKLSNGDIDVLEQHVAQAAIDWRDVLMLAGFGEDSHAHLAWHPEDVRYPCPCCGHRVFAEAPGSYDICPICGWEDDISQLRFPTMSGGANSFSLVDAQENYSRFSASRQAAIASVRPPRANEPCDPGWRPIDPERDSIEIPKPGIDYGTSYPSDSTTLYYWRG